MFNFLGNNESFEPYTSNLYVRRVLSGEFICINQHLVKELISQVNNSLFININYIRIYGQQGLNHKLWLTMDQSKILKKSLTKLREYIKQYGKFHKRQ